LIRLVILVLEEAEAEKKPKQFLYLQILRQNHTIQAEKEDMPGKNNFV
jgi:hypothetical protein